MFPEEQGTFLLPKLSDSELNRLKEIFDNDQELIKRPAQKFSGLNSFNLAKEVIAPIIDNVLGNGTWKVAAGHFFDSNFAYGLHSDGSKFESNYNDAWQTFVFPLDVELIDPAKPMGEMFVLITGQTWRGPSASFRRGQRNTDSIKMEYDNHKIEIVTDYSLIGNLQPGFVDPKFKQYTELGDETVRGLTVEHLLPWIPGVPGTFPRSRIHCSSNFSKSNVKSKRALSVFTSRRDQ